MKKECLKGVIPEKIRLLTKLSKPRDHTPAWCIKGVDFLNFTSRDDIQTPSIRANSWKNCKAGSWNLSYECVTSTTALNEWFCLSPEYRAKIKGSQPLPVEVSVEKPELDLEKDKIEAEEGDDDEDVPAELAKSVVIGENLPVLPPGYSISEGRLAYNEEWDETAELQSDSEEEWYDF